MVQLECPRVTQALGHASFWNPVFENQCTIITAILPLLFMKLLTLLEKLHEDTCINYLFVGWTHHIIIKEKSPSYIDRNMIINNE